MTFADIAVLKAAWLIPLALVLLWWAFNVRTRRILAFFGGSARSWVSGGRAALKGALFVLALFLLILGLAGPRWDFEWQEVKRGGVDIMIVLDVSQSMLAEDVSPNRLERAKREVVDLLGTAQGDRLGLVAFAGTAFVQCPLTSDYGAVRIFLDHLDTDLIATQGTDIGFALQVAAEGLAQGGPAEATGQAILLMTDGEDLEGVGLQQAEQLAAKGIKIFTMSIGTEDGGPIPIAGGGFKKDRSGNLIISRPDIAALKTMAVTGGGSYVSSVATDADLRYLYNQGIKATLEDREFETTRKRLWYERFQWFLLAAFLVLVLEFLLRDVRPRRTQTVTMLLLGLLSLRSEGILAASPGVAGQKVFDQGEYDKAADLFLEAEIEEPSSAQHIYNKGVADYKAGQFDAAVKAFERAADKAEGPLKEQALFNLGNAQAMSGDLKNAVKAFEETLQLRPEHEQASENLQYVKQLIEQQPPPQKGEGENDEKDPDAKPSDESQKSEPQTEDAESESEPKQDQAAQEGSEEGEGDPQQDQQGEESEEAAEQEKSDQQQAEQEESGEPEGEENSAKAQEPNREQSEGASEMTPEEAERVLRSVQNYSQRYLVLS